MEAKKVANPRSFLLGGDKLGLQIGPRFFSVWALVCGQPWRFDLECTSHGFDFALGGDVAELVIGINTRQPFEKSPIQT